MTYLVDTDVVADWLNGRTEAVELLSTLRGDGLVISLVTYGEIYDGVYYGRDPTAAERAFLQFLRSVDVAPLTRATMRRFAVIRGQLRRSGLTVQDADLLIAATALTRELTLVTRNVRHFGRVPGLKMIHP